MNSENKAFIKTHLGNTREITIKDNIKQGGVLSGIEYSGLTDEVAKTRYKTTKEYY